METGAERVRWTASSDGVGSSELIDDSTGMESATMESARGGDAGDGGSSTSRDRRPNIRRTAYRKDPFLIFMACSALRESS